MVASGSIKNPVRILKCGKESLANHRGPFKNPLMDLKDPKDAYRMLEDVAGIPAGSQYNLQEPLKDLSKILKRA